MYVCGPTVYNYAHIGNARPPGGVRRAGRGCCVVLHADLRPQRHRRRRQDQRRGASRRRRPIGEMTARYTRGVSTRTCAALGVAPPDVEPRVTEHMPQIIAMIERLVARATRTRPRATCCSPCASFADYGQLSRPRPDDMLAGARVEVAPYKRDPGDFVLWKPSTPDCPAGTSPWGRGRPGWHIECSAMAEAHLGETIDIHGGGVDLHVSAPRERARAEHVRATAASRSRATGCTTASCSSTARRCRSRSATCGWCANCVAEHARRDRAARAADGALSPAARLDGAAHRRSRGRSSTACTARCARLGSRATLTHAPAAAPPPAGVIAALEDDLNTPEALAELFGVVRAANPRRPIRPRSARSRNRCAPAPGCSAYWRRTRPPGSKACK